MDLLTLLGTAGKPAVIAGSLYGIFDLAERHASAEARAALTLWLKSLDSTKASGLLKGIIELFERLFGQRHFSLKCIVRSIFAAALSLIFVFLMFYIYHHVRGGIVRFAGVFAANFSIFILIVFVFYYLALYKTRILLHFIHGRNISAAYTALVVVIDYSAGLLLFVLLFNAIYYNWTGGIIEPEHISGLVLFGSLHSILFYAGMAPSIWLWTYLFAAFAARTMLRNEVRWFFDIDKNPFRSLGAIAALCSYAAVALILTVASVIGQ